MPPFLVFQRVGSAIMQTKNIDCHAEFILRPVLSFAHRKEAGESILFLISFYIIRVNYGYGNNLIDLDLFTVCNLNRLLDRLIAH